MPPELIVVPDCTAPASSSSVPPLSTVVLLAVPADTAKVTPLLTIKPDMLPTRRVAPGSRLVAVAVPPLSMSSVPPLETVVPMALSARADDFGAATVDRRAGGCGTSSDLLHAAILDRSAGCRAVVGLGTTGANRRAIGSGAEQHVLRPAAVDHCACGDTMDLLRAPIADSRRIVEAVDDFYAAAIERGTARHAVDELITAAIDGGRVRRPIDELDTAAVDHGPACLEFDELNAAVDGRAAVCSQRRIRCRR